MSNIRKMNDRGISGSSSLEDYLEAILVLSGNAGAAVRVTDLSERLAVSKPSVSIAMKKLAQAGLVSHERYGDIRLTADGKRRAKDVIERHELLLRFLRDILGVEESVAENDACRLEHDLSPQTVDRLSRFVTFLTGGHSKDGEWISLFDKYLDEGKHHADLLVRR